MFGVTPRQQRLAAEVSALHYLNDVGELTDKEMQVHLHQLCGCSRACTAAVVGPLFGASATLLGMGCHEVAEGGGHVLLYLAPAVLCFLFGEDIREERHPLKREDWNEPLPRDDDGWSPEVQS